MYPVQMIHRSDFSDGVLPTQQPREIRTARQKHSWGLFGPGHAGPLFRPTPWCHTIIEVHQTLGTSDCVSQSLVHSQLLSHPLQSCTPLHPHKQPRRHVPSRYLDDRLRLRWAARLPRHTPPLPCPCQRPLSSPRYLIAHVLGATKQRCRARHEDDWRQRDSHCRGAILASCR
jgi:hypothetical protein